MTGKKNVPNLRFKEFEDEWAKKRLGDICEVKKGSQINKLNLKDKDSLNKYYVLNGGINPSGYYHKFNVKGNSISISEGGNSCGYVSLNNEDFWSGGHCYTLKDISNDLKTSYLYHYLKGNQQNIMNLRVGSGLPNIQKKDIVKMSIPIPSIPEQQKIGKFLSSLDNLIEKQEEKVRLLEAQKKALMQKIFSQAIRFKDDEGNEFPKWKEKRLWELIASKCKGSAPNYTDCGNLLLSTESLENSSINIFVSNKEDVTINDLLILWDGSQAGKVYTNRKGVLGSTFVKLTLNDSSNNIYLYQFLKLKNNRINICWREGSGIPHVSKDFLRNFKVPAPSLPEQEKIAGFLSSFDKLIEKEREILSNQKQLKQGLLQQMFV